MRIRQATNQCHIFTFITARAAGAQKPQGKPKPGRAQTNGTAAGGADPSSSGLLLLGSLAWSGLQMRGE